ncbi:adenine deaminase, partial [Candidatus Woesearchaeota archaeon CG_4_10_14_0_2_um_filter_57_5]
MQPNTLTGNLVNVITGEIYGATITFTDTIQSVVATGKKYDTFIAPGFIDAHIHVESSMLCPSRFAETVAPHGTVATVSDPHEIANVLGIPGIKYMIADAANTPLKIRFTAPSCVPATPFESAGATLGPEEVAEILALPEVVALGEFMNFPGVINRDKMCMAKIDAAKKAGKPIDGHAPLVTGDGLQKYASAGITTDHECTTAEEANEKSRLGLKILIREGSSAKNMEALIGIKAPFAIVSDDKHPDDLLKGHLDSTLAKAVALGMNPVVALQCVTINPATHYGLDTGVIAPGRPADLVVLKDLKNFSVMATYVDGMKIAEDGKALFTAEPLQTESGMQFTIPEREVLQIACTGATALVRTIKIIPDQIVTDEGEAMLPVVDGTLRLSRGQDVLKIVVADRYGHGNIAVAFVEGLGIKEGAIASTVAHDSHNMIVAGTDDEYILTAMAALAETGGMAVVTPNETTVLELPIAGLMTDKPAKHVAARMDELNALV